jgi:hypothetical protein
VGARRAGRRRLALGLALGVSPYLVHLVLAGPGNSVRGMVLEPVFKLRPGRAAAVPAADRRLHELPQPGLRLPRVPLAGPGLPPAAADRGLVLGAGRGA